MNQTIRELHSRKSVRVYEDRPVEAEIKKAILDAAIQAPTAGNLNNIDELPKIGYDIKWRDVYGTHLPHLRSDFEPRRTRIPLWEEPQL